MSRHLPTAGQAIILGFLCHWLPGHAAEFHGAEAVIDEVVADTETLVPLRKVAAPIPFENFRYPFVDDEENVLFIGNDRYTYGARMGSGIFRSQASDGRLDALVMEDDPAPDDGMPMGLILGLQTDRRSFVFHRGPDRGSGIYARFGSGPLVTIAGRNTPVPGTSGRFKWFWYADIWEDLVVFNGTPESTGQPVNGLYLRKRDEENPRCLLDSSQAVAVAGGGELCQLSYQPRIDGSWLVFSANRSAGDPGGVMPGRGILGWPVSEGGDPETMFARDRLQVLAPFGMPIPESDGLPLTSAPNPMVDQGLVAVVAGSDATNPMEESPAWQAICIRTPDGKWHNPVDVNTLIPGRNDGCRFTGFNKWLAIHDGKVVFLGHGPDGYTAVYIYDTLKQHLYFVADTTWKVDGKMIVGFEIGRHPMVGQRLALTIRFSDRTSGQYLATLKGLPAPMVRQSIDGQRKDPS